MQKREGGRTSAKIVEICLTLLEILSAAHRIGTVASHVIERLIVADTCGIRPRENKNAKILFERWGREENSDAQGATRGGRALRYTGLNTRRKGLRKHAGNEHRRSGEREPKHGGEANHDDAGAGMGGKGIE